MHCGIRGWGCGEEMIASHISHWFRQLVGFLINLYCEAFQICRVTFVIESASSYNTIIPDPLSQNHITSQCSQRYILYLPHTPACTSKYLPLQPLRILYKYQNLGFVSLQKPRKKVGGQYFLVSPLTTWYQEKKSFTLFTWHHSSTCISPATKKAKPRIFNIQGALGTHAPFHFHALFSKNLAPIIGLAPAPLK